MFHFIMKYRKYSFKSKCKICLDILFRLAIHFFSKLQFVLISFIYFLFVFYWFILFFNFLLLFNYSCPHFLALLSPAPPPPNSYILSPRTVSLFLGPLYMFLDLTLPHLSPLFLSPLSSLVTVSLFFISMPLVLSCLFVCFLDLMLIHWPLQVILTYFP